MCSGCVCVCVAPTGWAILKANIIKSRQWSYLSVNWKGDGVLTKIPDLVVIRSLTKIYEEIKSFRAQAKLLVSNWSISAETMASWIFQDFVILVGVQTWFPLRSSPTPAGKRPPPPPLPSSPYSPKLYPAQGRIAPMWGMEWVEERQAHRYFSLSQSSCSAW